MVRINDHDHQIWALSSLALDRSGAALGPLSTRSWLVLGCSRLLLGFSSPLLATLGPQRFPLCIRLLLAAFEPLLAEWARSSLALYRSGAALGPLCTRSWLALGCSRMLLGFSSPLLAAVELLLAASAPLLGATDNIPDIPKTKGLWGVKCRYRKGLG